MLLIKNEKLRTCLPAGRLKMSSFPTGKH